MANDIKRRDPARNAGAFDRTGAPAASARFTLLGCVAALGVLLTQLPGPAEAWDTLTGGAQLPSGADPLAAVQSVLLTTAGLMTWLLAGWVTVVLVIGLLARVPGHPGRRARRLLPRIAPAAVARLVLAAVGVSLIAGTAACAAPAAAPAAGASFSSSVASSPPASTAPSPPASGAATTAVSGTATAAGEITIDWPDATQAPAPTPFSTPTAPAGPSSVRPTGDPTAPATETEAATETASATTATATTDPATDPATVPGTIAATSTSGSSPAAPTAPTAPTPANPASGSTAQPAPPPALPSPAPTGPEPEPAAVRIVTVQPGDSLWRIAAHSLGPDATDADIDNAWRAWYFGNRAVIGDDPNRILPGQSLVAPGGEQVQR